MFIYNHRNDVAIATHSMSLSSTIALFWSNVSRGASIFHGILWEIKIFAQSFLFTSVVIIIINYLFALSMVIARSMSHSSISFCDRVSASSWLKYTDVIAFSYMCHTFYIFIVNANALRWMKSARNRIQLIINLIRMFCGCCCSYCVHCMWSEKQINCCYNYWIGVDWLVCLLVLFFVMHFVKRFQRCQPHRDIYLNRWLNFRESEKRYVHFIHPSQSSAIDCN